MSTKFLEKSNAGSYKEPTISIRESTGLSIYAASIRTMQEKFPDGNPDSVKIGVDDDAGWIVLLPVEGMDGYKLPDEVRTRGLGSENIKNFLLAEATELHETDLPITLKGYWDDNEGALLFEYK